MTVTLENYLEGFGKITEEQIPSIAEQFHRIELKKGEFFLRDGEICKNLGFVQSGLLMYYRVEENGNESVADFAQETTWVSQYQSFTSRQPAAIFIRALEPCVINAISLDKLLGLYELIPGFERLSKEIIENVFIAMINRQLEFQNLQAEERYTKMLQLYPSLIQRVPQYSIASFLNIAPPSLSRIRKKFSI